LEAVERLESGSAADAVAGRDRQKGRDLTLGSVKAYKSVLRKSNGNSGLDSFLRGGGPLHGYYYCRSMAITTEDTSFTRFWTSIAAITGSR